MKKSQAGGYIFENVIWDILRRSGYVKVRSQNIDGRGAAHQIDASGLLGIPTPFVYPIRLICEAKFREDIIGLPEVRNFVGVYKDIAENYFVRAARLRHRPRYTDSACMFSKSSFSDDAQNYAWAHNIFLVSFNNVFILRPIIEYINQFLDTFPQDEVQFNKEELIRQFKQYTSSRPQEQTNSEISLVVGVLSEKYPIILAGHKDFVEYLHNKRLAQTDTLIATKNYRESSGLDTLFSLSFNEGYTDRNQVQFSIPNAIARQLIPRIDAAIPGEIVLRIDIPFVAGRGNNKIRRIYKVQASLPRP